MRHPGQSALRVAGSGGPSSPWLPRLPVKRLRLDLPEEGEEAHPDLKMPDKKGLSAAFLKRVFVV